MECDFFYSLQIQIKGSQNILNINLQSAFEGGGTLAAESEQLFTRSTWGYLKLKTFTFLSTKDNYRTRAIITCGLYIFYPLFEGQKRFFKGLYS